MLDMLMDVPEYKLARKLVKLRGQAYLPDDTLKDLVDVGCEGENEGWGIILKMMHNCTTKSPPGISFSIASLQYQFENRRE